jgi:hypothetical protein
MPTLSYTGGRPGASPRSHLRLADGVDRVSRNVLHTDAAEHEAVIPAEERQIVHAPQAVVVATRSSRRNEGDVNEAKNGGVLEQEAE